MIQQRTANVDGTPVRWLEQGSGVAVVLVHGIPTSPALWRHVLPLLPGLRVLAFEMTGYGQSIPAGRTRDISVGAQADRLNAWLDHLDIDRAVLVGHDLGGGVVHIAAVRRPELCAGLLITNGIGYDSWPIPSVKAMRAASSLLAHLPAIALNPHSGSCSGGVTKPPPRRKRPSGCTTGPTPSTAAAPPWPDRSRPSMCTTPSPSRTPSRR